MSDTALRSPSSWAPEVPRYHEHVVQVLHSADRRERSRSVSTHTVIGWVEATGNGATRQFGGIIIRSVTIRIESRTTIWEPLLELVPLLQESRDQLPRERSQLRQALNQSIVFHSACLVEGALEQAQRSLLDKRVAYLRQAKIPNMPDRKYFHSFVKDIEESLRTRIARATGLQEQLAVLDLLTGPSFVGSKMSDSVGETVTVLFQFRNVLAHGRQINAFSSNGPATDGEWSRTFSGGYRKVEDYLHKKKMMTVRMLEPDPETDDSEKAVAELFADSVSDHFWDAVITLFVDISEVLRAAPELKPVFDEAVSPILSIATAR